MNLIIYYFTGTGNCLAVAKQIHNNFEGSQIIAIAKENEKSEIIIDSEYAIFIFPTYAYQMPKLVSRFIKRATITSNYIAAIATYASSSGVIFSEMKSILKRKKKTLNYCADIKTVENYIPMFKLPSNNEIKVLIEKQSEQTESIIADIKEQKTNTPHRRRMGMLFIAKLFRLVRGLFALSYRIDKSCNGCAVCQKVCPANAIKMKNEKPKFNTKCEHCQACLNFCPKKAIKYIHYSPTSRRYTHSDVKVNEINQNIK